MGINLTDNYKLKKPEKNEFFNVQHQNDNMDVIDGQLKENTEAVLKKVDRIQGKGLSTEDFTTAEKNKLAGVPTNAGEMKISEAVRTLYGLTAAEGNVDKALKKIPPKMEVIQRFTTSQLFLIPSTVTKIDLYMVGGGQNGGDGGEDTKGSSGSIAYGGKGGDGGAILYLTNLVVTPNTTVAIVIGQAGSPSSFDKFSTDDSSFFFSNPNTPSTSLSTLSTYPKNVLGLRCCPFDGKIYGIPGAPGGFAKWYTKTYGAGSNISLFGLNKVGGSGTIVAGKDHTSGGGGASYENNGGNGSEIKGGDGGNASPNTGHGGGGGGGATGGDKYDGTLSGLGGVGGSGIVIVRYYK
ncbi:hypothetical protein Ami103574_04625 [Aminipila butyrica]|uniref:Glycine-rich domain-containing protein n=1 Tax=Aminipila butyrica TaxID=433296 RepID=A0A858BSU7_9FIRM|nr:hypothetical protein [Aminipila butyrica]QIB68647.1 hypothetical protein Ami103574_04625 [Aminipila butyrica]